MTAKQFSKLEWLKRTSGHKFTGCEFRVLLALFNHSGKDGQKAHPGIDLLAAETGYKHSAISNACKALRERGWIHERYRGNGPAKAASVFDMVSDAPNPGFRCSPERAGNCATCRETSTGVDISSDSPRVETSTGMDASHTDGELQTSIPVSETSTPMIETSILVDETSTGVDTYRSCKSDPEGSDPKRSDPELLASKGEEDQHRGVLMENRGVVGRRQEGSSTTHPFEAEGAAAAAATEDRVTDPWGEGSAGGIFHLSQTSRVAVSAPDPFDLSSSDEDRTALALLLGAIKASGERRVGAKSAAPTMRVSSPEAKRIVLDAVDRGELLLVEGEYAKYLTIPT
jgi:hypothetical protein